MDSPESSAAQRAAASAAELPAAVARTRARVVEAARQQVAAGDTSVAMNALARRAGVGVGTVYRHFPTQQSLLEAVAAEGLEALTHEADAASGADDPAAGLHRLLAYGLHQQLRDAGVAAVLAWPGSAGARAHGATSELETSFARVLERARAAGVVRSEVTADDVRRMVCGVRYALEAGERYAGDVEKYLSVLVAGLAPGPLSPAPGRG